MREQVWAEAHSNITYTEVSQEKLTNPPILSQTYDRLLLNIGTFAGLLCIHFGEACPYYIKTMEMYDMMDMEVVAMLEEKFTPQLCREVTWAWLEDRRFFFSRIVTPDQFATGRIK